MKNYKKRINIWIDEDFEYDIEFIKKYLECRIAKDCGKVSSSDAIRYAIKEYAEVCRDVEERLGIKS